jgi:hypothetical protein
MSPTQKEKPPPVVTAFPNTQAVLERTKIKSCVPTGPETKHDCANEGQQQITGLESRRLVLPRTLCLRLQFYCVRSPFNKMEAWHVIVGMCMNCMASSLVQRYVIWFVKASNDYI